MNKEAKFCSKCGAALEKDTCFCGVCGAQVNDTETNDKKKVPTKKIMTSSPELKKETGQNDRHALDTDNSSGNLRFWIIITIGFLILGGAYLYTEHSSQRTFTKANSNNKPTLDSRGIIPRERGKLVFLSECATCHGETGGGRYGTSHNLTSRMSKEQILSVIKDGSNQLHYPMGAMPAGMAQGADAEVIATYVAGGMRGEQPAAFGVCVGCHGINGKGNSGMTPNLVEFDETLIKSILENGKKGIIGNMPSFRGKVIQEDIKALTSYIGTLKE